MPRFMLLTQRIAEPIYKKRIDEELNKNKDKVIKVG